MRGSLSFLSASIFLSTSCRRPTRRPFAGLSSTFPFKDMKYQPPNCVMRLFASDDQNHHDRPAEPELANGRDRGSRRRWAETIIEKHQFRHAALPLLGKQGHAPRHVDLRLAPEHLAQRASPAHHRASVGLLIDKPDEAKQGKVEPDDLAGCNMVPAAS